MCVDSGRGRGYVHPADTGSRGDDAADDEGSRGIQSTTLPESPELGDWSGELDGAGQPVGMHRSRKHPQATSPIVFLYHERFLLAQQQPRGFTG